MAYSEGEGERRSKEYSLKDHLGNRNIVVERAFVKRNTGQSISRPFFENKMLRGIYYIFRIPATPRFRVYTIFLGLGLGFSHPILMYVQYTLFFSKLYFFRPVFVLTNIPLCQLIFRRIFLDLYSATHSEEPD